MDTWGGRGHGEGELGLAAIIDGQTLQKKRAKTGSSTTTSGVEDHESLKTGAVVGELADAVEREVNNLLADGVVATGVVVGGVLLAGDDLLGVVQLTVSASADLVADSGLKINEHGTGDVLASTSLGEEGVEGVVAGSDVGRGLAVGLDSKKESDLVGFWFGGGFGGGRRETRTKGD